MRASLEKETEQVRVRLESETSEVRIRADKAIRGLEYMQLGERLLAARNFKAALDIYLEAHKLDPHNRATNYFLGELYIQRKDTKDIDKGIEHLKHALAGGADFAPAEAALGYALRFRGKGPSPMKNATACTPKQKRDSCGRSKLTRQPAILTTSRSTGY